MFCKINISRYFITFISVSRTLLSDLCYDHSVNSTDLTAQCSRFLFLSVHGPKISTALERIAQICHICHFLHLSCKEGIVALQTSGEKLGRCASRVSALNQKQTCQLDVFANSTSKYAGNLFPIGRQRPPTPRRQHIVALTLIVAILPSN